MNETKAGEEQESSMVCVDGKTLAALLSAAKTVQAGFLFFAPRAAAGSRHEAMLVSAGEIDRLATILKKQMEDNRRVD